MTNTTETRTTQIFRVKDRPCEPVTGSFKVWNLFSVVSG